MPLAGNTLKTPCPFSAIVNEVWVSPLLTSWMVWYRVCPEEQGTKVTREEGRGYTIGMNGIEV
jgi:hypothetical protein